MAIGLGCMRLSTDDNRDEGRAIAVIHAALDAGATLLDTGNAYCHDERDTGHNERLIAHALARWSGDRSLITIATKGGLRRPKGQWVNDGRAKHLKEACDASRAALGVDCIDLYQLHAVDPKVDLETSVRALATLQHQGKIREIGLCNVTVDQIARARALASIVSVQVSLSVFDDENLRNGVGEYCRDNGIRVIAYRPLGGERVKKLARDAVVSAIAVKHAAAPADVALAWLMSFDEVVPIPGATRVATAQTIARACAIELDADDRLALDARFSGRLLRVPRAQRRPAVRASGSGEIVVVMGMPGAGKTTYARTLEERGYSRLNRDAVGGSLADLIPRLDAALGEGALNAVLDNTYPTRASRNAVIETAWSHGLPVRCLWLTTTLGDAQLNAIHRMIDAHGGLPGPEEIRARSGDDSRYLLPDAQFRYERILEPPTLGEGFESVERIDFSRGADDESSSRAIIFDADHLLDIDPSVAAQRRAKLIAFQNDGWLLFAHAWRPQVARGTQTAADVEQELELLRLALGDMDVACCAHDAGPPICWCRKPIPGSVVAFARRRNVSLRKSIVIGKPGADRTVAERIGARFELSDAFFGA